MVGVFKLHKIISTVEAQADLSEYAIQLELCACGCTNHKKQVDYRDEMVGTQLIAGAYNNEHRARVLADLADLTSLEGKLARLCMLEKSES